METTFLRILPLLLGAAISPIACVGMIAVLTSKEHPRMRGLMYLIGTAIPLILIGIPGIIFFVHLQIRVPNPSHGSLIDLIAGVILLFMAARRIFFPSKKTHHALASKQDISYPATILLGMGLMITNITTLVLYIPALKDIAISGLSIAEKFSLLVASIIITLSLIAVPLFILLLFPKKAGGLLRSLGNWLGEHNHEVILGMLIVFGIYMLLRGFGLLGS